MLKKISREKAIFELLEVNGKIFVKGYDGTYIKAVDCIFRFRDYGEGYDLKDVAFYLEIEDD